MQKQKNKRTSSNSGFTLLEILVALSVFAILTVMAFEGLNGTVRTRETLEQETDRWKELLFFFNRVESDLKNIATRPIVGELGGILPPLLGASEYMDERAINLSLTRFGSALESGKLAVMKRVGYRLREGQMELLIWPVLDQPTRSDPETYTLLTGVAGLSLRYLDEALEWRMDWGADSIPRAVEFAITLDTGQTIRRLVALR